MEITNFAYLSLLLLLFEKKAIYVMSSVLEEELK